MRIAILTVQESLYLPEFFRCFLEQRAKDVVGIFPCRPINKNQTRFSMLSRYMKTFGLWNTFQLMARILAAKAKDVLKIGRRHGRFYSVESVAKYYNVPVETPDDVNAPEFLDKLRSLNTDVILSVSCPQIFKEELINLPSKGCLNIHGADLPEYRGLLPSFWMLADGLTEAAVTIFFVDTGIDTGQVAGKVRFPILPEDSLDSFIRRSKREACKLALEVMERIEAGTIEKTPLEGKGSYFGWPTRRDYRRFRKAGRSIW